jgi:hypothetical protein
MLPFYFRTGNLVFLHLQNKRKYSRSRRQKNAADVRRD